MINRRLQKFSIGLLAALTVAAFNTPASANGGYYGGYGFYGSGFHGGFHSGGFRSSGFRGRGFRGRGFRSRGFRGRGFRRGGGGRAAAIALGVVGGAIIINELAEDRARSRSFDGRRSDRFRGDNYDDGFAEGFERGRESLEQPAERPAEIPSTNGRTDQDVDRALDGGPEPIRVDYGRAYDACLQQAREALGERGFVLSAPYKPATAENRGGSWVLTATVNAQRGADAWSRALSCEADSGRVYRLELI